jgi:hypothetical protein
MHKIRVTERPPCRHAEQFALKLDGRPQEPSTSALRAVTANSSRGSFLFAELQIWEGLQPFGSDAVPHHWGTRQAVLGEKLDGRKRVLVKAGPLSRGSDPGGGRRGRLSL